MLRLTPEQRRAAILFAGAQIANAEGLEKVTPRKVSNACELKTSRATVLYYFRTQAELWLGIATHFSASKKVVTDAKRLGLLDDDE